MPSPRSALKFDLFADSSRKGTLDELGDPLQVIARHIDFGELAGLADADSFAAVRALNATARTSGAN